MTISISGVTSNLATTNGVVTGDGAFDDLMEAVNIQLKNQFDLGRITGTDYANVYLGAMQFAIQNAVQFTLTKDKADAEKALITAQELEVEASTIRQDSSVEAQISLSRAQKTLADNQAATELKNALDVVANTNLKNSQKAEVEASTARQDSATTAQVRLVNAQRILADNQALSEVKTSLDIEAATELKESQKSLVDQQAVTELKNTLDVVSATALKTEQKKQLQSETIDKKLTTKAELSIAEQKLITEKITNGEEINQYIWEIEYAQDPNNTYTFTTIQNLTENDVTSLRNFDPHVAGYTVQSVVLNQVTNIRTAGTSLAEANIQKTEQEVAVLAQKEITEYAQTEVTTKTSPTATSITGRQSSLYEKQASGFKWDAKNTHNKNKIDYEKALLLNDGVLTDDFEIIDPTTGQ